MRRGLIATLAVVGCVVAGGCAATGWRQAPHDRPFQKVAPPILHAVPPQRAPSPWWDVAFHSTVRPLSETLNPGHYASHLVGPPDALDVNSFGQVPDSPWFNNRIGRASMSVEEVRRGSSQGREAPFGLLTVVFARTPRPTPALVARDARGQLWHIKFDPPAYPGMTTGAELISSNLLYAAGYHVPDIHLVTLDLGRLRLGDDATQLDDYNREVRFSEWDLIVLLSQLNPSEDGTLRATMSRFVGEELVGPFAFSGVRASDPNDTIPHERRRSLRGLWLFSAWLNHVDVSQENTIDAFVRSPGQGGGYLKHYLLDFDSTQGARGHVPKPIPSGYRYELDWREIGRRLFGFGLYYPYWLPVHPTGFRAVGVFEAEVFEPALWRPSAPNPAFEQAAALDTYWAASILARTTPTHVRAAVAAAGYREPGASEWISSVLLARRTKLLRHAFAPVLPLDNPRVVAGYQVLLDDLDVLTGLLQPSEARYDWQLRWNRSDTAEVELGVGSEARPEVNLGAVIEAARREQEGALTADPFVTLTWQREVAGNASPRYELHLRLLADRLLPVGCWRQVD